MTIIYFLLDSKPPPLDPSMMEWRGKMLNYQISEFLKSSHTYLHNFNHTQERLMLTLLLSILTSHKIMSDVAGPWGPIRILHLFSSPCLRQLTLSS